MLHFIVPRARRASAWLVMTVLTALMCFLVILPAATAQSDSNSSTQAKQAEAPANISAGQWIAKDPATGQLREPTPEEVKELDALQAKKAPKVRKPLKTMTAAPAEATGAVGVMLDESYESYTVATRSADGRVKLDCVQGKDEAEAKVQSDATQPTTKEAGNEK